MFVVSLIQFVNWSFPSLLPPLSIKGLLWGPAEHGQEKEAPEVGEGKGECE